MRVVILSLLLVVCSVVARAQSEKNKTDARAQALIAQARAAIGTDKLKSLAATGSYRRVLGEREMSGDIELEMMLPDKYLKTETLSPMPGIEITRTEAINGEAAWMDTQNSGGGGGMVVFRQGPVGGGNLNPQEAQKVQQQAVRAEISRLLLGLLLTTPSSFPVEFSYAGEAEAPDGRADVLNVKGPNGFVAQLFLDQKSHLPLMLTYKARKPRIVMNTVTARSREEIEKLQKEGAAGAQAQVPQDEPPVEFQVHFADYRNLSGVTLPHRISKSIEGQVTEEMELSKFKINPSIKADKFEKK
ncbi:MAG TPA: hypothetical protein VNQ79_07785 [Blastocatellia bacterium]|nr:hypothetical protein [Blastocatellia bacterium]